MLKLNTYIVIIVLLTGSFLQCAAQDLRSSLTDMIQDGCSETVFKQYLSPLSKAFGTDMSSAMSYSASAKQFPHLGLTINVLSTGIPGKQRYFINDEGQKVPTVFGDTSVNDRYPDGTAQNALQFPVAQLHLGLFSSLEFIFRYTDWEINRIGHVSLTGFGIKYELIDINPGFRNPFVVSLMAYYHNLRLEECIESGSFGMTFILSKKLDSVPLEVLTGVRYTNNVMTFESRHISGESNLGSVTIDGLNGLLYHLGSTFDLYFIRLHADYNLGEYSAFTGGITVEF